MAKCKHPRRRTEVRLVGNRVVTVVYCAVRDCGRLLDTNRRKATPKELNQGQPDS